MNTVNVFFIALIIFGHTMQGAAQATNKPCICNTFEAEKEKLPIAIATNPSKAETSKKLIVLIDQLDVAFQQGNQQAAAKLALIIHEETVQFAKVQRDTAQQTLAMTSDPKKAAHSRTILAACEETFNPSKATSRVKALANGACPKEKCPCGSKRQYKKCCGKIKSQTPAKNAMQVADAGVGAAGKQG